ncbi:undecaprenyldiphospho-muramoylpentapeptide beta-N-acetylglucosaminyltransferase [Niabella ginsengisoli]|uniref:UDP-N-acetylglucosamine--N-acetylmuramyl-(pentapeptide) pyrophosphoryl-undecaprenol N-acetylglucosamine transferase n=1 Tax=Niabella ginsengisoli TaxID=522298 RepID=A0ABS9SR63_9BACT|nr:undecaprenyldiphospho-muramoylpentapeptide beta-N-acetylglucosaminyltransferase [Niabella ginsengisoli]MCH5600883.1 undecaprenyldiphospho-muramoylpentapeptide beta-N-acetylglucosaminyltransferase [Niabella ginsengisoli]
MSKRIIIAGGGTGGHIFPAIAIANAIRLQQPDVEFLFVGAKGKMEMERVPQAGFRIEGIDIAGLNRSSLIKNIGLPAKIIKSFFQVRKIFSEFHPDAVIGVGGYSTFPVLKHAQAKGIPTFIHESNSFAGKANKMLGKGASKIFTGTDGMEKFFPAGKIMVTGNPVRKEIVESKIDKNDAINFFELEHNKPTLLVVGGSLGAKSINEAVLAGIDELIKAGLQIIWQTGKSLAEEAAQKAAEHKEVWANTFISNMEMAYAAADIVIARAGAMTVAEICVTNKPTIFVPYPFAAEDHQTVNAQQLVNKNAALMVKDADAKTKVVKMAIELAANADKRNEISHNLSQLAITNAAERVATEVLKTIE